MFMMSAAIHKVDIWRIYIVVYNCLKRAKGNQFNVVS